MYLNYHVIHHICYQLMCVSIISYTALFTVANLAAAETKNTLNIKILANSDLQALMDIDVSVSSRLPTSLRNTLGSVTIFRREDIERLGVNTLNHLLHFVPGLMLTGGSNGIISHASIRGDTSSFANNTLLLIDGIPVNNYINAAWMYENNFYPLANIERVEVMRGPSAAIYGMSAISAVINLIPSESGTQLEIQSGSEQRAGINGRLTQLFGDTQITSSFTLYRDNGYAFNKLQTFDPQWDISDHANDGIIDRSKDPITRKNINIRLNRAALEAGLSYQGYETEGYYNRDGLINNPYPSQAKQNMWFINYTPELGEHTNLKLQYMGHADSQRNGLAVVDKRRTIPTNDRYGFYAFGPKGYISPESDIANRYPNGLPFDAFGYNVVASTTQQINSDINWEASKRMNLALGAGVEYNRLYRDTTYHNYNLDTLDYAPEFIASYGENNIYSDQATSEFNLNIHGEAHIKLSNQLDINIGGRYDKLENYDPVFSPRLALPYTFNHRHSAQFTYNEAFRRQNPSLLYNTLLPISRDLLKTIHFRMYEISHEYNNDMVYNQLVFFYSQTRGNGLITVTESNAFIKPLAANTSAGVELANKLFIGAGFQLDSTLSYLFDQGITSKTAVVAPTKLTASLALNYAWQPWNFNINGYYIHSNEHREILSAEMGRAPSITLFHCTSRYQINSKTKLNLTIFNLFDKITNNYEAPRPEIDGLYYPIRGRQYQIGLNYAF